MDTNLNNDMEKEKDQGDRDINYKGDEKIEVQCDRELKEESKYTKEQTGKEKKKKFIPSVLIVLIVLFFSVISVGSYVPIRDNILSSKDHTKNYIESSSFSYTLSEVTKYLKQAKLEGNDWYDSRYEDLESIKYYIRDRDTTQSISNISNVTDSVLQAQINNSQFYMIVKTDENSDFTVQSSLNKRSNERFKDALLNLTNQNVEEYANLDIAYVIPQDLDNYNDLFTHNVKNFNMGPYLALILGIGIVGILILTITVFSIPYSLYSRTAICRLFNKMFLELKLFLLLGFGVGVYVGVDYLARVSMDGYYGPNDIFNLTDIIYNANEYFYFIGIPMTFVLYLLIYLSIVYIKYIYHTGFKEGLILNSLLGRICFILLRKSKEIFQSIIRIDIRKSIYRKLILILGINLIILRTIAISGELGVIIAIVYTIILFKYLSEFFMKIKTINDASSKLEQGDFDIKLDEKMGIFTPIAKNLNNIKDGLKVAIDKEIRSQKMKTELISNVSHDLKTPLTSIITYVDLLKNQDNTEKTQKEYIEVLDRKSKRLKVLIEDLFEASKASSGNIDLVLEKVDIIALFRQTLGELEEKINHSNLQIKMNVPEEKLICELDGRRTYRVFENIMNNILKYSMPNSRVYIDVVEGEREVSFIFKNISAYEMNFDAVEITERFTRGDKSRNTEGSGLGLAIAKNLVELQNGELSIKIDGDLFKLIITFPIEN